MTEPLKLQLTKNEILAIGAYTFGKQLPDYLQVAYNTALAKAAELGMNKLGLVASAILDLDGTRTVSPEEVIALNALPFRE